ncbi:hypothetical protein EDC04DRAFT_1742069 [Pisolithus marmoratus]|nr:hypothetical protein EDC04DRAFT_1742069 [Pisolithus marmoratus]
MASRLSLKSNGPLLDQRLLILHSSKVPPRRHMHQTITPLRHVSWMKTTIRSKTSVQRSQSLACHLDHNAATPDHGVVCGSRNHMSFHRQVAESSDFTPPPLLASNSNLVSRLNGKQDACRPLLILPSSHHITRVCNSRYSWALLLAKMEHHRCITRGHWNTQDHPSNHVTNHNSILSSPHTSRQSSGHPPTF